MTPEQAREILEQRPDNWERVWQAAVDRLDFAKSAMVPDVSAAYAANLVRELVPLTGQWICVQGWPEPRCANDPHDEGESCTAGPHGQDVLGLYVRATRLALGEEWIEWLVAHDGWHLGREVIGGHGRRYAAQGGAPSITLTSCRALVYDDGTVECGPACPSLPEVM